MVNFFIKTYGCQANVADSSNLSKYLQGLGAVPVEKESEADLIIINTCAIREKAESKMFSYLGELAPYKKDKSVQMIGVIGCVASYRKEEILKRFPHIDFVFGARQDLEKFKAFLTDKIESIATSKKIFSKPKDPEFKRSMINIMRGCNNFCSYCIVPFTTGRERSYPMSRILEQIKRDVDAGAKEITLLGQNVNSYKDPETGGGFEKLMEEAGKIEGDFWIRFVSPHPKDMSIDLLRVIAANEKLCSYIHLPLQSGSNKILKLMKRTYTAEEFVELARKVKEILPDSVISTDIIVGFPGETEEDYQKTRDVVEQVEFQTIFSFIYSPRKYTKAALLLDDCPREEKLRRLQELQVRHREIGTMINKRLIGKTVRVLLEEYDSKRGCYIGRTEGNCKVFVTGDDLRVNNFVKVKIENARLSDISGVCVSE